jgi:hypothetical protein
MAPDRGILSSVSDSGITAHLPPELRAVLIEVMVVARQVATAPRDRAWTNEHVNPLVKTLAPLSGMVMAVDRNDGLLVQLIRIQLQNVESTAVGGRPPQTEMPLPDPLSISARRPKSA